MRAYLAMQAMETGKGLGGSYLGRSGMMSYGHNGMLLGAEAGQGKVCKSTVVVWIQESVRSRTRWRLIIRQ